MHLEYSGSFGKKKCFDIQSANGCTISSDNNDDICIASLEKGAKVSVFQEGNAWVMMGINCLLLVDGKDCQSVDLQEGMEIVIAKKKFKVLVEEDKAKVKAVSRELSPKNSDLPQQGSKLAYKKYTTILIVLIFVSVLLLLFFIQSKNATNLADTAASIEGNASSSVVQSDAKIDANQAGQHLDEPEKSKSNTDASGVQQSLDPENKIDGSKDSDKPVVDVAEGSAYAFYINALSHYDHGFLKQAIQEVQSGLLKYPGDPLLLSKLNDWESKLNILISQSYKNACLHALYLRNLEAQQTFAMVIEMAIDTKDVRYRESLRMYEGLENANVDERLECGAL